MGAKLMLIELSSFYDSGNINYSSLISCAS